MNSAAAIITFVAPAMTIAKSNQGPPPNDPHSTLKLLAVGFLFVVIAAGSVFSMLTSPKKNGDQDDRPK